MRSPLEVALGSVVLAHHNPVEQFGCSVTDLFANQFQLLQVVLYFLSVLIRLHIFAVGYQLG